MSWPPTTESELELAISVGSLTEKHRVELKRQLNSGPKDNTELARDIASFAVDGGLIFIGVDEHIGTPGPPTIYPIPLDIRERIEQVARSRIDPPLTVETIEIPAGPEPSKGVVVVVIPGSPDAPHMVEGEYFGRADSHKFRMGDAEVRRLHEVGVRRMRSLADALDARIEADPVKGQHGHIHAIARPVINRRRLVMDAVAKTTPHTFFYGHIVNGPPAAPLSQQWGPDLGAEAQTLSRRADGWAIHTYSMGTDGRVTEQGNESGLLDFEVTEDGEVRLYCGRGTDAAGREQTKVCLEVVVGGLAKRLVLIASELSAQCGFEGTWEFDFAITGLSGAVSHTVWMDFRSEATPYSGDVYREAASATTIEMRDHLDDVVLRLVGRLNRALNDGKLGVP